MTGSWRSESAGYFLSDVAKRTKQSILRVTIIAVKLTGYEAQQMGKVALFYVEQTVTLHIFVLLRVSPNVCTY